MEYGIRTLVLGYYVMATAVFFSNSMPIKKEEKLKLCDIHKQKDALSTIICHVGRNQALDYRSVREFTKKESGKFSVTINCKDGGLVALPWPMKAENVKELSVLGCLIDNFLSEMTVQNKIADELSSLFLSDVSIEIPLRELYNLSINPNTITSDADCGQLSLESIIFRNLHFELEISADDRHGEASRMLHFGGHHEKLHPHTKVCVFSNLRYLEETASRVSGQYHLKLIPDHAEFPKLEIYNVSNNNLDHVPRDLRNLKSKKFPLLKKIDLSNNVLRTFEFEVPDTANKTCNVKTVNLQNNRISTLPLRTVKRLKQIGTIFVDLRKNPLECSCKLSSLRRYLQLQYDKTTDISQRKQISDITCVNSKSMVGKHRELSILHPSFDKNCVT